jgi:hypothetical protein
MDRAGHARGAMWPNELRVDLVCGSCCGERCAIDMGSPPYDGGGQPCVRRAPPGDTTCSTRGRDGVDYSEIRTWRAKPVKGDNSSDESGRALVDLVQERICRRSHALDERLPKSDHEGGLLSPRVYNNTSEPLWKRRGDSLDSTGNRGKFVAAEGSRDQDDSGMSLAARNIVMCQEDKVTQISSDEHAFSLGGVVKLLRVRQLGSSDLVRTAHVQPALPKKICNDGREIFVEVELHPIRTSPGNLAVTASGVRAAFSSISRSMSFGYARAYKRPAVSWGSESDGNADWSALTSSPSSRKSLKTSQTPRPVPAILAVRPDGSLAK